MKKHELLQIKVGRRLQRWGVFMENTLVTSSKNLWFWDLYSTTGRDMVLSKILRAELVQPQP